VLTLADVAAGLRPIAVPLVDELAARGFADAPAPLGAVVYRPTLYRRNGVAWSSVRSWRADARGRDLARLKLCKAALDGAVIEAAAAEIVALMRLLFGPLVGWSVTTVACGHSRRPDCFGKRLGQAAAVALQLPFVEIFEDRFVSSTSHPKEFRKLPPLVWRSKPYSPVLIIDDLATSGWHMEEALGRVRDLQQPSFGVVWISGTVT
jgi:hypothetical protein